MNTPKKIIASFAAFSLLAGLFISAPMVSAKSKKQKKVIVSSTAFRNGGDIPTKYAYNGFDIPGAENLSIPLAWKVTKKVAAKTKSFAVTVIDHHPIAQNFVHLIAYNIPASTRNLEEGAGSGDMAKAPLGTLVVAATDGTIGYVGPYPPPNEGKHVYDITVYALNAEKLELEVFSQISEAGFKKLLKGKIVAKGKLKGKFGYTTTSMEGAMDDSMGDSMAMAPMTTKTVEITSAGFSPNSVTVKTGEKVKFLNKDTEVHWPASNPHPVHTAYPQGGGCISSAFDACKALAQNEEWEFTFTQAGTWAYHDHLNAGVTGTVIVE
jgi:Raf kinase inhibitor-like YbhB/YbcL family protein